MVQRLTYRWGCCAPQLCQQGVQMYLLMFWMCLLACLSPETRQAAPLSTHANDTV